MKQYKEEKMYTLSYIIIPNKGLTLIWYVMALGIEMATPFNINTKLQVKLRWEEIQDGLFLTHICCHL